MNEVTGRLEFVPYWGEWMLNSNAPNERGCDEWWFARRIDAIAFARRKGIRLVTQ